MAETRSSCACRSGPFRWGRVVTGKKVRRGRLSLWPSYAISFCVVFYRVRAPAQQIPTSHASRQTDGRTSAIPRGPVPTCLLVFRFCRNRIPVSERRVASPSRRVHLSVNPNTASTTSISVLNESSSQKLMTLWASDDDPSYRLHDVFRFQPHGRRKRFFFFFLTSI